MLCAFSLCSKIKSISQLINEAEDDQINELHVQHPIASHPRFTSTKGIALKDIVKALMRDVEEALVKSNLHGMYPGMYSSVGRMDMLIDRRQ
jgi:hypothetical protein